MGLEECVRAAVVGVMGFFVVLLFGVRSVRNEMQRC